MKKIKAILYDLDGAFVDACDWHCHPLNDALEEYMSYKISYKEHLETFNGLSTKIKLDILGI
jgi:beta-phosphoglucomutase-like phosphatase (HAD superfamily)